MRHLIIRRRFFLHCGNRYYCEICHSIHTGKCIHIYFITKYLQCFFQIHYTKQVSRFFNNFSSNLILYVLVFDKGYITQKYFWHSQDKFQAQEIQQQKYNSLLTYQYVFRDSHAKLSHTKDGGSISSSVSCIGSEERIQFCKILLVALLTCFFALDYNYYCDFLNLYRGSVLIGSQF